MRPLLIASLVIFYGCSDGSSPQTTAITTGSSECGSISLCKQRCMQIVGQIENESAASGLQGNSAYFTQVQRQCEGMPVNAADSSTWPKRSDF